MCIQRAELGMNDIYKMFFSFLFDFWEMSVRELDLVVHQERMLKDFYKISQTKKAVWKFNGIHRTFWKI